MVKAVSIETGVRTEQFAANGDTRGDFVSQAINLADGTANFASPSAGTLVLGSKQHAGRWLTPAWRNEDGGTYTVQPDPFLTNYWSYSIPQSGQAGVQFNIAFATDQVVGVVPTYTTNPLTAKPRLRLQTSSALAAVAQYRQLNTRYLYLSTHDTTTVRQANGFYYKTVICFEVYSSRSRMFFGVASVVTAQVNVDPSSLLNSVGFIKRAADANLCFYSAGAAAGTVVDLGANFKLFDVPTNVGAEFELTLYNPKGSAEIYWSALNRSNNTFASGVANPASRPANQSFLAVRGWVSSHDGALPVTVATTGACGGTPV